MKLLIVAATGRLGRVVTRLALSEGHEVTALVRTPEKLGALAEQVHVVRGDLGDPQSIERAVQGVQAVISCAGPTTNGAEQPDLFRRGFTALTEAMARHGVDRIVAMNGAGVVLEGERPRLGRRLLNGFMDLIAANVMNANRVMLEVLAASDRAWTAVRAPRLLDGPPRGNVRAADQEVSASITRSDVAKFMLDQLDDATWVGKAPLVGTG